jgi:mono/diheme cytochrome c family protein
MLRLKAAVLPAALCGAAALAAVGCQNNVPVQTRINAMPDTASGSVRTVENTLPSSEVDAGRPALDPATGKTVPPPGSGSAVWASNCIKCHGAAGKPVVAGAPDLSDPVWCWTRTPKEFFSSLETSPAHTGPNGVVGMDRQSLWNATYYAWTLHSSVSDVVQGGALFGRYCSVCHGTKGRGDGNLVPDINPRPRVFVEFGWMVDKTDQRLYISISDGRPPSAMPGWKTILSPTQRIQIINYIRQFTYKHPEDIGKKMAELPPAG